MKGKQVSSIKRFWLMLIFLTMAVLTACGQSEPAANSQGQLKVTATIGMISDMVRQVGGEHVEVRGLMKSGVDPHLYKASQGDVKKLEQAA